MSEQHPLVSIIIPCYNAERYVAEAIQSALDQTYPNKEVIVIDDGSTDGSLEVIKSFGHKIRWETCPNRGGSAARNRGIELARGEFIQFLDADDLLHPEKLERQAPVVLAHPGDVVYCDFVRQDISSGAYLEVVRNQQRGEDAVVFAVAHKRLSTPAPLHRKDNLESVGGFNIALPCSQEYDLHIRMACRGFGFRHVPEVLYVNRQRPNSVSADCVRVFEQHERIIKQAYETLRSWGTLTDERARALAGCLASNGRAFLRFGRSDLARRSFRLARTLHPDGGIPEAYSPPTRLLRRVVGPRVTEALVVWKRTFGHGAKQYAGDATLREPQNQAEGADG